MGKGLPAALRQCPSGSNALLASDLEFIQANSLLTPPVPAPAPGLPAQGQSDHASLCPDPKGGKKWLERGIWEKSPLTPSSLTFAAG